MTDRNKPELEAFETQINDLLEGRLQAEEAERLKADAKADQKLAAAIIDAYQLHRAMEEVGIEKAPPSLTRKLMRVPSRSRPAWQQPRWVAAYAAVPVMVFSLALLQPNTPSVTELQQAQEELAVAFAYIDRVSDRTSSRIEFEVGHEMKNAVAGSIFKSIHQQNILE